MRRFFKYLLYFFIASIILNALIEIFEDIPDNKESFNKGLDEIKEVGSKEEVENAENETQTSKRTIEKPLVIKEKEPSRDERLKMIADSIFQSIPITSYQDLFNDIVMNEDRALEIAQKMHPDPNDFIAEREAQLNLEEQYFKRWAEAKFSWYKTLELPEEDKYSVLYNIRAKISGIGVRNGWLDEYDAKK